MIQRDVRKMPVKVSTHAQKTVTGEKVGTLCQSFPFFILFKHQIWELQG